MNEFSRHSLNGFDFCLSESLNWNTWSDDVDFPSNITDVFQATFFCVKEDGRNI